jgi:hypothetical protein
MKYVILILSVLIFFSCTSENHVSELSSEMKNIPLIPYIMQDESYNDILGYVHAETFEIIIPTQYKEAFPFVGDFAIVVDLEKNTHVINKDNIKIDVFSKKYDKVSLFRMDEGEHVFLLTKKYSWFKTFQRNYGWLEFPYELRPASVAFRLYNVSTGKAVTGNDHRLLPSNNVDPKIVFVDNVLRYDDIVYEITEDGNLRKTRLHPDDVIALTAEKRMLQRKEQDFFRYDAVTEGPYNTASFGTTRDFFDLYFPYVDTLNIDSLLQIIPQNMEIDGWQDSSANHLSITPINWDPLYPLPKYDILYEIRMKSKENSDIKYTGLYNASKNRWIIEPFERAFSSRLYSTHYENFIKYEYSSNYRTQYVFYDLDTRKKYTNIFSMQNPNLPTRRMVYAGYENEYYKQQNRMNFVRETAIEDF